MLFDDDTRALLDGKNFASVATLNPDGGPQSSVVWMRREDDTIVFTAIKGRRKVRNLLRDPRVSVTVFDLGNPYHSVEIRGRATVTDDPAKELPEHLSRRYLGVSPPPEPADLERVVVRVIPERINVFRV
ncbi:PPOX class F420-dependent oxidoreductase [Virgisporangium aliadipatigenens]|uniref:PPOX class F420-dependent oxidoreductase n=1 Tax=Virgisporangium aliadipatigenens TaxID=741659 RepID=UPI001EF21B14|nr:PPOX class F420-dependent oxidoreductase [Virgisporangium aliadipatigenens]